MVEPVDPLQRGELEVIAAAPGTTAVDQLRLVEPDHGLRQGVVVRVAAAADRGRHPRLSQPLRVADREVLHAAVRVMDEPSQRSLSCPQRLLQCVECEVGAQRP